MKVYSSESVGRPSSKDVAKVYNDLKRHSPEHRLLARAQELACFAKRQARNGAMVKPGSCVFGVRAKEARRRLKLLSSSCNNRRALSGSIEDHAMELAGKCDSRLHSSVRGARSYDRFLHRRARLVKEARGQTLLRFPEQFGQGICERIRSLGTLPSDA